MLKKLLKDRSVPAADTIELDDFSAAVKYSSRRKTLTIKVESGAVLVQAPVFATRREIESFLHRKSAWIRQKLTQQQEQLSARQRCWLSGESLPLLGDLVQLKVEPGGKGPVVLEDRTLRVPVRASLAADRVRSSVQSRVQRWYRQRAAGDIAERLVYWQGVTGITAKAHCVKTYKARWGSCNHRAELSFNWKLVMAPPAVVDYVVVHELCHIVHFNHSPAYWRLVEQYQPDYKVYKAWLRNNGLGLEL